MNDNDNDHNDTDTTTTTTAATTTTTTASAATTTTTTTTTRTTGVREHPEWFEGLTAGSSRDDFQRLVHRHFPQDCRLPCTEARHIYIYTSLSIYLSIHLSIYLSI